MMWRAGLGVTFPCSSAGLWVPCVELHPLVHLVSGLPDREARRKDRSVSGIPVPFLGAIGLRGRGERSPRLGNVGGMGLVGLSG